jgi:hypothetical protein
VLRKDRSTSAVLGWRQDAVIEERSVTLFAMTVPFYGQTTRSGYNVIVRIGAEHAAPIRETTRGNRQPGGRRSRALPTYGVVVLFVLGVQPGFEWGEIVGHGGSVQFALAGDDFQSIGPRLTLAHGEHFV